MKFSTTDFFLEFTTPFSIAHGTRSGTDIVLLQIESEGIKASGEASLPPYLKENKVTVKKFINAFLESGIDSTEGLQSILKRLMKFTSENYAAKCCVDIALHNWFAKRLDVPVWKMLGLENQPLPECTFTIGMAIKSIIAEKINEARDFNILKIKLGGENDKQIIRNIRESSDKPICVDVNQGWASKEFALEMINWLKDQNVLFVEQPLPKNNLADMEWLHEHSPLPLIADESVQVADDIKKIAASFDGINVKLMKCGGINEGLKMIREGRLHNLKILIGSMSETSCGIMAAAQLSSLADWVDLDGPLLTKNNPFEKPDYQNGRILI